MDNEATKVVEPQKNENVNKEQMADAAQKETKKTGADLLGRAAATAAGAAVGTGAAMAAERLYDHVAAAKAEDVVEEEVAAEEEAVTAEGEEVAAEEVATEQTGAATAAAPQVTTVNHVVTVRVETVNHEPVTAAVESPVPADGEYIDDSAQLAAQETTEAEADNEVHVIGVHAAPTEDGGQAIIVGLEAANGDRALVVDIDSDGTIDYLVHDDNENGQIEENEVYDIHEEGWQTENYLAAYEEEQHQQQMEDELWMAENDEMPDYMNDADAGIMDA